MTRLKWKIYWTPFLLQYGQGIVCFPLYRYDAGGIEVKSLDKHKERQRDTFRHRQGQGKTKKDRERERERERERNIG